MEEEEDESPVDGMHGISGEGGVIGAEDERMEEGDENGATTKRGEVAAATPARNEAEGAVLGPKKTRVVIKDAAWSTWWAILYWVRHSKLVLLKA
jgi:hypothetical protein